MYKAVYRIIECLYEEVEGLKSNAAVVTKALVSNRLWAEAMEGSSYVLTHKQAVEYQYMKRLVHRIATHMEMLQPRSKELHAWQALQVVATVVSPIDAPPHGSEMGWLASNLCMGSKALVKGQERSRVLIESSGDDGLYFHESKGEYRNRTNVRYPHLPLRVTTAWLSDGITKATPNTSAWAVSHVQRGGHNYPPPADGGDDGEKRRKGKTRKCIHGDGIGKPLRITDPEPAKVADAILEKQGKVCYTTPIRYKIGSDKLAYSIFKQQNPDITDITSYAFFVDHKPECVQPEKRDTCCCIHHMEGDHLLADLYREQLVIRPGREEEEQKDEADLGDGRGNLHAKCGTDLGCKCRLCISGDCKTFELNPFYHHPTQAHTMAERLKAVESLVLCPDGDRTEDCYEGTCDGCGLELKMSLRLCPMEKSNDKVKVKLRTYEAPGSVAPTTLGDRDEALGDDDDDDEAEKEDNVPDAEETAGRKAMHWRFVSATRKQLWEYAAKKMRAFIHHRYIARKQQEAYDRCKAHLKPGHPMIQLDFNMSWAHGYKVEAQSQFYVKTQTTILPVVGWVVGRDGVSTRVVNYVYLSPDTNHSNNFVQYVINDVIKRLASLMETWDVALTHLHIWSDGCGGQFKNRYQLKYIIDSVKAKAGALTTTSGKGIIMKHVGHHFFASCHGKGPCDSAGAVVKTLLRGALEADIDIRNTDEAFTYLRDHHTIDLWWATDDGRRDDRNPRIFVYVGMKEIDHLKRPDVGKVDGMKACHSFVTIGRESELHMAALSCFCVSCITATNESYVDSCEWIKDGSRSAPTLKTVKTVAQRARESRDAQEEALLHSKTILAQCNAGDLVLLYFDPRERDEWNGWARANEESSWSISGKYKVAEVAMMPDLPEGPRQRRSTRADATTLPLYLAGDIATDSHYGFPLVATCEATNRQKRAYPKWEDCRIRGCKCKHACDIRVDRIVAKVPRTFDGGADRVDDIAMEEQVTLGDRLVQEVDKMMVARRKEFGLFYNDPLIPFDEQA